MTEVMRRAESTHLNERIIELRAQGLTYRVIGIRLGKSKMVIQERAKRLRRKG